MKIQIIAVILVLLVVGISISIAQSTPTSMPKVGDAAPLFEGKDQNGNMFKLADVLRSKKVILLYFYPKDFTGGCTKEACGLRDRMGDLQANNVEVIGVSHDTVDSHKKFADQYKLNFTLIA